MNCAGQLQLYEDCWLEQVPPFWQGELTQKFGGGAVQKE